MTFARISVVIAFGALNGLASANGTYSYTVFDPPGASGSVAYGINNDGVIVGYSSTTTQFDANTYVRSADGSSYQQSPGSNISFLSINDSGTIAGQYYFAGREYGFVQDGLGFHSINVLGTIGGPDQAATGVNSFGVVTGYADGVSYLYTGYDGPDPKFTFFQVPGSVNDSTIAQGINNLGQVVGYFRAVNATGSFVTESFIRNMDGSFLTFTMPGAIDTYARGINDLGQIVGSSTIAGEFVRSADGLTYDTLTSPGDYPGDGHAYGINNSGEVVGYSQTNGGTNTHSFLAIPNTVPEPSSLLMLATGAIGVAIAARRRNRPR